MDPNKSLPIDIITDILVRLPTKPLIRFKIVCKSWYDLISDPNFAKRHLQRSLTTQSNRYFVYRERFYHIAEFDTFDNAVELNHPFKTHDHADVSTIGSCNGLLCLGKYDHDGLIVFLFNPITRTHKMIPFLPRPPHVARLKHHFIYGFGYDSGADDYKFVRILQCFSHQQQEEEEVVSYSELMVYSMKSNSWMRVLDHVPIHFDCRQKDGVLVNENLHWVNGNELDEPPRTMVSFNLSTYSFGEVAVPVNEIDGSSYMFMHAGVLDGCLCILINSWEDNEIMVMKEYGVVESWAKLLRVRKTECLNLMERTIAYSMERTIAYTRSKKELLVSLFLRRFGSIDLENMVIEDLSRFHNASRRHDVDVCVENLLMLDSFSDLVESEQQGGENKDEEEEIKEKTKEEKLMTDARLLERTQTVKIKD